MVKNTIAYITSATIPSRTANSIHVMKMCEAFAGHGINTMLIVPDTAEPDLKEHDPYQFYGVAKNFAIIRTPLITRFPIGLLNYLFASLAVCKAWRLKPQLIYTRHPIAALLSLIFSIPVVLELHEQIPVTATSARGFKLFNVYRRNKLLRLVVITRPLKNYYIQQGCPEDKILVLADAVNFKPYEHFTLPVEKKQRYRIGYVGSFYKGRGIELICDLAGLDPDDDFLLYGGSEDEIAFWQQETKDKKNIFFYKHILNARMPSVLNDMDILLMPYQNVVSVSGNRGNTAKIMSPLKMFEYMASGRPIISSRIAVLQEVLVHEQNCLLVRPDKVQEWHEAIVRLKTDRLLAVRLGKTAREQVKNNFTWEKRSMRILEVI